jgi:hypothetical protein
MMADVSQLSSRDKGGIGMWEKISQRVIRMVKFDNTVYKDIEADEAANSEALAIVIVACLLSAVGSGVASLEAGAGFGGFLRSFLGGAIIRPLIGWLLWSWVTMFVGTRLYKADTNFWEMARCLGYANAPVALGILAVIPCLGWLVALAAWILSLVFGFLAAREALDLTTEKTIITIAIGWVVVFVIQIALASIRLL